MTATTPDRRTLVLLALGAVGVAAADMAVAMGYWCVIRDAAPARILQGIAGGWLGREAALAGGWPTALLGAGSHLGLATAMVVAYWAASRRLPWLVAHPVAGGLAYGLVTWATMKFVVVPLSALDGGGSRDPLWQALHFGSHLFVVGLPSAWLARRIAAAPT